MTYNVFGGTLNPTLLLLEENNVVSYLGLLPLSRMTLAWPSTSSTCVNFSWISTNLTPLQNIHRLLGLWRVFFIFIDDFLMCVRLMHVIAVGWTSVRLSRAGIVSKWLNLLSNCFHCLVAP